MSAEPSALPAVMGPNPAVGPAALPLSIWRSSRRGAGFPPPLRCAPHDLFPRRLPAFVWLMWTGVVAARQYRQPSELSQEVMITCKRFRRAIDACLYASGPNANLSWLFAFSALVDQDARAAGYLLNPEQEKMEDTVDVGVAGRRRGSSRQILMSARDPTPSMKAPV